MLTVTNQTVDLINHETGTIHKAQIFVSVMGASNYTYAEATLSQKIEDWKVPMSVHFLSWAVFRWPLFLII